MSEFWKTPEVESWYRGFNYIDYISTHSKMKVTGKALTNIGYACFCAAMESNMRHDLEADCPQEGGNKPS